MEASGRVKRSFKAKLMMSFYTRAPKSMQNYYNNKVKKTTTSHVSFPTPPPPPLPPQPSHVSFPTLPPPPPPPQPKTTKNADVVSYGAVRNFTGEDNVDRMATCYILRVQEGFRREQVDYGDWR